MCCLRKQRMILWIGFILCLIVQMIVFATVDGEIIYDGKRPASGDDKRLTQTLMFIPCVTLGIFIDIQIIVSTY